MQTSDAIRNRRSVRYFTPGQTVTDAQLRELFELVSLTPSSFNIQHWNFIAVRDAAVRKDLRALAWDQAQVTDAAAVIAVVADPLAFRQGPAIWEKSDVPDQVKKTFAGMIGQFYEGKEQLSRDEALRSIGMASMTLMLAAESMGFQTGPMIGFDPVGVAKRLGVIEPSFVAMLIVLGHADPAKQGKSRPYRRSVSEIVHLDTATGPTL